MKEKVYTIHLEEWEETITGWLIDENEEQVLIHGLLVDYVFDGYSLIRKKFISKIVREGKEKDVELVTQLRQESHTIKDFQFGDTLFLLRWIEKNFGMVEFKDDEEGAMFIGTIRKIVRGDVLNLNFIDSKGEISKKFDYDFELNKIHILSFDSNYFNAIKLLWQNRSKGMRVSDDKKR